MKITERTGRLPILATKRLILRDIRVEDISDAYLAWINDPETTKHLEIRHRKHSREDAEAFIKSRLEDIENVKHFGIYDQDGTRLVGNISANINHLHKSADISYIIGHPGAQGKGYATEAIHAIVYYLFRHAGIGHVWAGYYAGNKASARVLEKNGFTVQARIRKKLINHKGEREDHIIAAILPEEFQPNASLLGGE